MRPPENAAVAYRCLSLRKAACIRELRGQMNIGDSTGSWRTYRYAKRNGNLYPCHGLGPVAQYMSLARTEDNFRRLVSSGSPAKGRKPFAGKSNNLTNPELKTARLQVRRHHRVRICFCRSGSEKKETSGNGGQNATGVARFFSGGDDDIEPLLPPA